MNKIDINKRIGVLLCTTLVAMAANAQKLTCLLYTSPSPRD